MAYYGTTHLKDNNSEEFLRSRGFTLVSSCSPKSVWICPDAEPLFLDPNTIIKSDSDIYKILCKCVYDKAYFHGKEHSLESVYKLFRDTILTKEDLTNHYPEY